MIDLAKRGLSVCWAFSSLSVYLTVCVSLIIIAFVEVFLISKSCYLSITGLLWSSFLNGVKNNSGGRNGSLSVSLLQIPICGLTVNQTEQKLSMWVGINCYGLQISLFLLLRIYLQPEQSSSRKGCKLKIGRKNFQSFNILTTFSYGNYLDTFIKSYSVIVFYFI